MTCVKWTPTGDGREDVDIRCDCGKRLTRTNRYGMFCEDGCGEAESTKAGEEMMSLISAFLPEGEQ